MPVRSYAGKTVSESQSPRGKGSCPRASLGAYHPVLVRVQLFGWPACLSGGLYPAEHLLLLPALQVAPLVTDYRLNNASQLTGVYMRSLLRPAATLLRLAWNAGFRLKSRLPRPVGRSPLVYSAPERPESPHTGRSPFPACKSPRARAIAPCRPPEDAVFSVHAHPSGE